MVSYEHFKKKIDDRIKSEIEAAECEIDNEISSRGNLPIEVKIKYRLSKEVAETLKNRYEIAGWSIQIEEKGEPYINADKNEAFKFQHTLVILNGPPDVQK